MIKLLKYLKGSAIICAILAPLTMCLEVAMDLLQPTLLSKIIDTGVANGDLNYVLYIGIQMVIAAVVGLIAGSACSYFAAVASMNLGQEVRQGLFDKIQTLSFVELDKLKTSSLITRLTEILLPAAIEAFSSSVSSTDASIFFAISSALSIFGASPLLSKLPSVLPGSTCFSNEHPILEPFTPAS